MHAWVYSLIYWIWVAFWNQQNGVTHWLDLSQVYGSSEEEMRQIMIGGDAKNHPGKGQITVTNVQLPEDEGFRQ